MSVSNLFDALREELQIHNDAALSRVLEVEPAAICRGRKDDEISDRMILRIHERTGKPVVDIRALLAQPAPHQYHDNPGRVSATETNQ